MPSAASRHNEERNALFAKQDPTYKQRKKKEKNGYPSHQPALHSKKAGKK